MKKLSNEQVIEIHSILISQTGGSDGNKRIGILVMITFLEINVVEVTCTDEELITLGLGLADGSIGDEDLLNWIIEHS